MAAVIAYLLLELTVLATAQAYSDQPTIRAAIMSLWAIVVVGVTVTNPPQIFISRLMWTIGMWAYLAAIPRMLENIPPLLPVPLDTIIAGMFLIAIPAALILTPIFSMASNARTMVYARRAFRRAKSLRS